MKEINSLDGWDACYSESKLHPILVFKHSTACPISAEAYQQVAVYAQKAGESALPIFLVKVIESRPVSNQIAENLQLQHKSPQLILLRDGAPVWSSSHYGINGDAIRDAVAAHANR